jgi:hypothetical protein
MSSMIADLRDGWFLEEIIFLKKCRVNCILGLSLVSHIWVRVTFIRSNQINFASVFEVLNSSV